MMEETRAMTNPDRPLDDDSICEPGPIVPDCKCDGCKAYEYLVRVSNHICRAYPLPIEPVSMGPGYSEWEDTSDYEQKLERHPTTLLANVIEELIIDTHGLAGLYEYHDADSVDMSAPGPERKR